MKKTNVLCLLTLLALSGCALSEDLSPPVDGKAVKIAVVKPVDVDILPMDVIYRSENAGTKYSPQREQSLPGQVTTGLPFLLIRKKGAR
ncbi:hypothetical protein [Cronobacter turicensis]|uniref:hypothetical protein n=1 Tax=Cronobacter turicensis TaxID=413502 RepID=UPI000CFD2342|nr:hypothetical protein [Cronobacter turicensis]